MVSLTLRGGEPFSDAQITSILNRTYQPPLGPRKALYFASAHVSRGQSRVHATLVEHIAIRLYFIANILDR